MRDIYDIYDDLLEIELSIEGFDTAFKVLKKYYNIEENEEIFHWMLVLHGSIRNVVDEMKKVLIDMDECILKMSK